MRVYMKLDYLVCCLKINNEHITIYLEANVYRYQCFDFVGAEEKKLITCFNYAACKQNCSSRFELVFNIKECLHCTSSYCCVISTINASASIRSYNVFR